MMQVRGMIPPFVAALLMTGFAMTGFVYAAPSDSGAALRFVHDQRGATPPHAASTPPRPGVFTLPGVELPAAQDTPPASEDLAKKLQNPVADLISVPLQLNYDHGYGPDDAERWTLNIQPVIPFSISEDWNLISRTIVPIIYAEGLSDTDDSDVGIGDTVQSLFFSPKEPVGGDGWILGFGPVALLPTGTDPDLRAEQLALGPTGVALRQQGGWTYGLLFNHLWGVAGSGDVPDVNATFLQPFASYTFETKTTLTLNTESTYDWRTHDWTIPINLSVSQLTGVGSQPISLQFGARYYAERPGGGPDVGLRFGLTFLFPN
ncbi:MAG: hypothetical protein RIE32_14055 [Phycisphaerales bacterium]